MTTTILPESGAPSRRQVPTVAAALIVVIVFAALAGWWLLRPNHNTVASSTTSAVAATMTRSQFITAGNRVCAVMNADSIALGEMPKAPAAAATFVGKQVTIMQTALTGLEALTGPTADRAQLRSMYAEVSQMIGTAKLLMRDLRGGELARAKKLEARLGSQMNRANADYNAYGLTTCGS